MLQETRKIRIVFWYSREACLKHGAVYGEYSKVSGLRQKLESLCRELQRQNKMLFVSIFPLLTDWSLMSRMGGFIIWVILLFWCFMDSSF